MSVGELRSGLAWWPFPRRKNISRQLRHVVRRVLGSGEYRRVAALQDRYRGKRCFLLANGPSLAKLDLGKLADDDVFLVNMGFRAFDLGLPRAEFHMITDNNRYRRFAAEFEANAKRYNIAERFFPYACKRYWLRLPEKAARPYFLQSNPAAFLKRGMVSDPRDGYSGGSTVVLSALQLCHFLGFQEVFILGCDLDYQSDGAYFYAMGALDAVHAADPTVARRRSSMRLANDQFAKAREFYEADGRRLINAGIGGNLTALPRVDYDELF